MTDSSVIKFTLLRDWNVTSECQILMVNHWFISINRGTDKGIGYCIVITRKYLMTSLHVRVIRNGIFLNFLKHCKLKLLGTIKPVLHSLWILLKELWLRHLFLLEVWVFYSRASIIYSGVLLRISFVSATRSNYELFEVKKINIMFFFNLTFHYFIIFFSIEHRVLILRSFGNRNDSVHKI